MFITMQKEQFSIAYVHAVASGAGFKLVRCDGLVRIEAHVEGKLRAVDVELVGDDWQKAHAAMASRSVIRCEGELLRDRRPYFLQKGRNVREINVI
ncbi:hypothetical protein [Pendulispora albinea]|uniref:Uncharacterized protein n=1 Tax=Pendulispora albinea TaxID=2741071 RepID=A0ABZ2LRK5_9BACT